MIKDFATKISNYAQKKTKNFADAKRFADLLHIIENGTIKVFFNDDTYKTYGNNIPKASFRVHDDKFVDLVASRGDIGFAESYISGLWDSDDLATLLYIFNDNRQKLFLQIKPSFWNYIYYFINHWLRANTKNKARQNIYSHYDLGNDFFKLWLDPSMSYSSALFANKDISLQEAQNQKYDRILDRLELTSQNKLLDIGFGWGAFLNRASKNKLKNIWGITISPSQLEYSKKLLPSANLHLMDYRDLKDKFDRIVSIEMFEAVGKRYWPTYFDTIFRCLNKGGKALIQTIVIDEKIYSQYTSNPDFIQQYIFPGGMLPSCSIFIKLANQAKLKVLDSFSFGADYAKTLSIWHKNFEEKWPEIKKMGFDEHFRRLWKYYLCYCQAGFSNGSINVYQFELGK